MLPGTYKSTPTYYVILIGSGRKVTAALQHQLCDQGYRILLCQTADELKTDLDEAKPDGLVLYTQGFSDAELDDIANLGRMHTVPLLTVTDPRIELERPELLQSISDTRIGSDTPLWIIEAALHSLIDRDDSRHGRETEHSLRVPRTGEHSPIGGEATWLLDRVQWTLSAPDGGTVRLTFVELTIAEFILASPGNWISRDRITQALGKKESEASRRALDATIQRMRRKIKRSLGVELPVRAAYGKGYAFTSTGRILEEKVPLGRDSKVPR